MKLLAIGAIVLATGNCLHSEPIDDLSQTVIRWFDGCASSSRQNNILAFIMDQDCATNAFKYCETAIKLEPSSSCFVVLKERFTRETDTVMRILSEIETDDPIDSARLRRGIEQLETGDVLPCPQQMPDNPCAALQAAGIWMRARDFQRIGQ